MKLKKMNDEECLTKFLEFLNERVQLNTNFVQDPDTGLLTHQLIQITCGEFVTVSQPEPLEYPLRLATAEDFGLRLN